MVQFAKSSKFYEIWQIMWIFCTIITYGIRHNSHSGIVQSEITLEDLFA